MRRRTGCYNPNRRLAEAGTFSPDLLADLAVRAQYGGNPEHKHYPADYGLGPPPNPRPNKTLCDGDGLFPKRQAEELLRSGLKNWLVSQQIRNGWPQNVWAVDGKNVVYECQLENCVSGAYHGYPMPLEDAFRETVLSAWAKK